ncbi:MAG: hypothetical protein LBV79_02060, partial [Candidatus Adiutrix sp.]|nr:hypothetical protein [Candidatus Adiutrix sp.]
MKQLKKLTMLALAALCLLFPSAALAEPDKNNYQSVPFLSEGALVPEVLLVLSKDHKMFQQAYNPIIDFDGDGFVDTGYNPSVVYYGYFDSYSCYTYSSSNLNKDGDRNAYFYRVGPTIDDESTVTRPPASVLPLYIPAPRAVHHERSKQAGEKIGICQMPNSGGGNFSGNWLNFLVTSRFDVIRKVLYGGLRSTDQSNFTILEGSMVPTDAHVWGYDVMADDRWVKDTPQSVYYDVSKYTPYAKPGTNRAHFFARTRSFGNTNFPIFRYLLNTDHVYFTGTMHASLSSNTPEGRFWDWSLNERPNPNDGLLETYWVNAPGEVKGMTVRVQACKKDSFSETEGCKEYTPGTYKPVGLLQQHGEGDKMFFGLMTGSYHDAYRRQGGVLRHHIDSINSAVNPVDGTIIDRGLIWTLDRLRIVGRGDGTITSSTNYNYTNASAWGSPIGEMLFEGVRYMAGLDAPSSGYLPPNEVAITTSASTQPSFLKTWGGRPALAGSDECAKPVILLISDLDNDFDGDNFPTADFG